MGTIKPDVFNTHLASYPWERDLLAPLLSGFDVTWARRLRAHNTDLSVYFLSPEDSVRDLFGFEHEVALFVSNYPTLEPRSMQAINQLITQDPAAGRVDQGIFFIVTESQNGRAWVSDYVSRNPETRIPVVFIAGDLRRGLSDKWLARNTIRSQLFSRDLFDYQLPIDSDLFFFGRDQILADHLDAIRRSQNRGLFGLRKTGKTSILYKVQRMVEREGIGEVLYYDCKLPSLRMLRWDALLNRIIDDIAKAYKIKESANGGDRQNVSDRLFSVLSIVPKEKTTTLVFDEIEYISPLAVTDKHWHEDFVPFWQTLWSAQSQIRRLSTTIVGVNPSMVEMDTVAGVQNPMFGIIQSRYLQGLTTPEMHSMVSFFGRRMGLTFTPEALSYLTEQYGGHPLLTRMACSFVNSVFDREARPRPAIVSLRDLKDDQEARDAELVFYCRHIVSELQRFYSDEYQLLEMLSSKQIYDVMDLMSSSDLTRHLKGYGLIKEDSVKKPSFAIPVLGRYIAIEVARRERRQLFRRIIPQSDRAHWVARRASAITRESRELCKLIRLKGTAKIYGRDGFPEADKFCTIHPVELESEFESFINKCNRSFVESVEQLGRSEGNSSYFWSIIKQTYPDLWENLNRIKLYRNNQFHLELLDKVESAFQTQLEFDLDGKRVSQVNEVWFVLQQCVLDGLFLGLQCEINRLS